MAVVLLAAVFSFNSCKEAEVQMRTVTILVSEGVSGLPPAGAYTLVRGDDLQYSFTLNAGYSKLTVLWDGTEIQPSGTLTITSDHTLQAYADDNFQCALTVEMTDGVTGTPAAGTRNYPKGTVLNYSYALKDSFYGLTVLLDDELADSSGTITMNENHKIVISATESKNVRGTWQLSEAYQDGGTFNVTATFSGDSSEGTVTDSDGGSGTYTFIGATVKFNLVFPDVTYEYEGDFSDNDTMSGTCRRFQTAENAVNGSWIATRKTSSTTTTASRQPGAARRPGKGEAGPGAKR